MEKNVKCPVCESPLDVGAAMLGHKVQCGRCESISRIKPAADGTLQLKVLEETLNWQERLAASAASEAESSEASCAAHHEDPAPAGPRLVTRRDRFREAAAESVAPSGRRPTTNGRSRSGRRRF
ncbi:MAG: hypothetical protein KDB53_11140 [Planctomycetes bacterium]|nr:hypothetical protein [Planctomycetota bacterium]